MTAIADTSVLYEQVKHKIKGQVGRVVRNFGGDYEELLAHANYAFCVATKSFDPSKGNYDAWILFKIYGELICHRRRDLRFYSRYVVDSELEDYKAVSHHEKPFLDLQDSLSDDAWYVVEIIFNETQEFTAERRRFLQLLRQRSNQRPRQIKACLRRFLIDEADWKALRVRKTFLELENVL